MRVKDAPDFGIVRRQERVTFRDEHHLQLFAGRRLQLVAMLEVSSSPIAITLLLPQVVLHGQQEFHAPGAAAHHRHRVHVVVRIVIRHYY